MEQAEAQKAKDKRNSNSYYKKKSPWELFLFLVNHDFDIYCIFNTVQLRGTYYHVILKSRRRLSVLYEERFRLKHKFS
jgi:hypothetical protein